MVANKYRWDFIGLSTDEKPTPANSEKVVDGSTYYCSDTSKLYVFCKDTWYEKTATGGGGGGTTDFNDLDHRPKYNGMTMTGETDIPQVSTNLYVDVSDFTFDPSTPSENIFLYKDSSLTVSYTSEEVANAFRKGNPKMVAVDIGSETFYNFTETSVTSNNEIYGKINLGYINLVIDVSSSDTPNEYNITAIENE